MEKRLTANEIATEAGFVPDKDGKLNLPNTQEAADALSNATMRLLAWKSGNPPVDLIVTGAFPVWGWLKVQHAAHGLCRSFTYESPNCTVEIFSHGK